MAYFLRFTNDANADLERGTSLHASGMGEEVSLADMAAAFGCEESEVELIDGLWFQVLDGLCGYMLDAKTIEEAIEEVENNDYQFSFVGRPVIFSGRYSQDSELVPDGDLFTPFKIEVEL